MRKREFFRIEKFRRRYDRKAGKFVFNIAYKTAVAMSPRTVAVAEAFGLGIDEQKEFVIYDNVELKIGPKDIVYITGDSGSGKSVLLKAIRQDLSEEIVDMTDIHPDPDKSLIETVGKTVTEGLELLSRVGLNDAFLFLRKYSELSDGQKYRYRIAKLVESGKQWWIMDEFCSTLDRDTAKIVAFNLQKIARKEGKAVIAATTHTDLFEDLQPSVHIHKRFGKQIQINYCTYDTKTHKCSLVKEMKVVQGSYKDWKELAYFHYRSHRVAAVRNIFSLKRGDELCGVIVYCYSPIACFGRKEVLSKETRLDIKKLNKTVCIISRVVVHPKYRTIGLGAKLIRETLALAGTPCVELVAVMARYNPFAERAGMKKIAEQKPTKKVLAIVAVLEELGFNIHFLASQHYVLGKLEKLCPGDLEKVRDIFAHNKHPRFMKLFFKNAAYGYEKVYNEKVGKASLEDLARLIKLCGLLMQAKVYLFWPSPANSLFFVAEKCK